MADGVSWGNLGSGKGGGADVYTKERASADSQGSGVNLRAPQRTPLSYILFSRNPQFTSWVPGITEERKKLKSTSAHLERNNTLRNIFSARTNRIHLAGNKNRATKNISLRNYVSD